MASALAAALGPAWSAGAQSQPSPPRPSAAPNSQDLNPARRAIPRAQQQGDVFAAPAPLACPLRDSPLRFTLTDVRVNGSTTLSEAEVKAASTGELGREIPVGAICDIRDRLAQILFRRGVLARVEVPEQRIADGHLTLEVIEAHIVTVRVHGDIGPAQDKVEGYLDRLRGLTPFDLDTAQRYLLLANDVPGVTVTASLRPSAQGRGAIDLDVQVRRTPVQWVASTQNNGSEALGPWSLIGRVDLNSFTRFGEQTSLTAYSTLDARKQWVVQGAEQMRFGDQGLYGKFELAYGQSRPGGLLKPLKLEGESLIATLEAGYPIIRLRRENLTASVGLDAIEQKTTFAGGGVLTNDHLRVLWARLDGDVRRRLGSQLNVVLNGDLEVRKGVLGLGSSRAGQTLLSRVEGKPDAVVVRFDGEGHVQAPFTDISVRTEAQYADHPLLSFEELAVGQLTIGRGYEPAVLSGDRAVAAELKTQVGPFSPRAGYSFAPYAFYDIAKISNLDTGSTDRTIRSLGVGLSMAFPHQIRADLAWADPLDKPFASSTSRPPPSLLFQLVISR